VLVHFRRWAVPGLFAGTFLLMAGMFAWNSRQEDHPRGDGVYRPLLARGDGHLMYLMTLSVALDGDLDFQDELQAFGDPFHQPRTATGRRGIPHPIGPSLLWAPVLMGAQGAAHVANVFGAGVETHGYSQFHQTIVFFTSLIFAFATALLAWWVARGVAGPWSALYAAIAALLGTALLYYSTYMPGYAHAMDALATAGFLAYFAATLGDRRWRRYAILGALVGAAALVRITGWGLGLAVAFEVVVEVTKGGHARWRETPALLARGALALAVAVLVFTPQLVAWKILYGEWLTSPMGPGFVRLSEPRLLELLWSSRNGWLSSHPIAYLGIVGLAFLPRRAWRLTVPLALIVISQVYVNACVFDWWSGASFGQRRLVSLTFIVIVGLAGLLQAAARLARSLPRAARHAAAAAVLGWFVIWNVSLVRGLSRGRPAPTVAKPMCCPRVPRPMAWLAQPVYRAIGNPFAFPASLWFAARHRVSPARWDLAVGDYADMPDFDAYSADRHRGKPMVWNIPGVNFERWVFEGLSRPVKIDGKPARRMERGRARLFLPFFLSEPRELTLPVRVDGPPPAKVRLLVDDELLTAATVGIAWTNLTAVTRVSSGMHELVIESDAPLAVGALAIVVR
jgi:hypothetical protein